MREKLADQGDCKQQCFDQNFIHNNNENNNENINSNNNDNNFFSCPVEISSLYIP